MLTYPNRMHTEAALAAIDNGDDPSRFLPLSTIARKPLTIAAVNRAREVAPRERYAYLNRTAGRMFNAEKPTQAERQAVNDVWGTLPGYTCWIDALAITARL